MLRAGRSVRTVMGIIQSVTRGYQAARLTPEYTAIHTDVRRGPLRIIHASSTITAAMPVSTRNGT